LDGFPCIYLWEASTLKKINQIAITDEEIVSCEFSRNANLLLVLSKTQGVSTIAIWNYLEGHKDIFCKSQLPIELVACKWNYYIDDDLEFVTIGHGTYHFWKMSHDLAL
jgi:WD40 repeat protein